MTPQEFQSRHSAVIARVQEDTDHGVPVLRFIGHKGKQVAMKHPAGWPLCGDPVAVIYEPLLRALERLAAWPNPPAYADISGPGARP